jgi:hypothetical protein
MKIIKVGLGLFIFIFLSACQGQAVVIPTATSTLTQPTPTATSLPPTPVPTAASTPTQTVVWKNNSQKILMSPCVEVEPSLPKNIQIDYDLVVSNEEGHFVFDPVTQEKTAAVKDIAPDIIFSPDGEWGAYSRGSKLLVEPVENLTKSPPKKQLEWEGQNCIERVIDWLSKDQVILLQRRSETSSAGTVIYNPFTREVHTYFFWKIFQIPIKLLWAV